MSQFLTHPVPAVIILLGLLVFFHELGHFVVGRWCGIAVETFSIGFGPKIFGFTHRGTNYRLSWIPLGGYVKFAGSHPSEEVPPGLAGKAFYATPVWQRAVTVFAGPAANFVLAVFVYALLGLQGIPHPPPVVGEVIEGSPAARAGFMAGDQVLSINGRPTKTWRDIESMISTSPGVNLPVVVQRTVGGVSSTPTLSLTPDSVPNPYAFGKAAAMGRAGIALGEPAPIVTILSADGAAAVAGLKTGDRIVRLQAGDQSLTVRSYPQMTAWLREQARVGTTEVEVVATASTPPSQIEALSSPAPALATNSEASASEPQKHLRLRLTNAAEATKASPPVSDRTFMQALGLRDAALTIGTATDGAIERLKTGDVLLAWGDAPLADVYALRDHLVANTQPTATFKVLRGFTPIKVEVPLKGIEAQRPDGTFTVFTLPVLFWGQAIDQPPVVEIYSNPLLALAYGGRQTVTQTAELVSNIVSLLRGDVPLKALGGPMLIAKVAGDSARRGWQTFLGSLALISINLGLLNLFPIPVLDGGQLLLLGAEGIKRRPLGETAIESFQKIGFAMIMALVVLATYNDLSRFWRSMLESVVGLFQ